MKPRSTVRPAPVLRGVRKKDFRAARSYRAPAAFSGASISFAFGKGDRNQWRSDGLFLGCQSNRAEGPVVRSEVRRDQRQPPPVGLSLSARLGV